LFAKERRLIWHVLVAVGVAAAAGSTALAADPSATGGGSAPWGKPVDSIACRLVLQPRYAVGQAISAVIELKNTSDRTRYLVPRLDPRAVEHLTLELVGPHGKKVPQTSSARGFGLSENSFEALAPGEVRRFDIVDLRDCFGALEAWRTYRGLKGNDVPAGRYTLRCSFRSPKVPEQFGVAQRVVGGKVERVYKTPNPALLALQWAHEVAAAPVAFELQPLGKDDLVVHEWGVFTVFNDVQYANADRKAEWGSLPSFFYRQFPKERLRWSPSAWDKPIVYFYAKPQPLRVGVKVTFTDGAPVVWWPAAADPYDDWPGGIHTKKPRPYRSLAWEAWLGDRVPAPGGIRFGGAPGKDPLVKVTEFPLPADCWLREARLPAAARLTVTGTDPDTARRRPGLPDRLETERFLYYDGLVPAPTYLRCEKVEAGAVVLRNRARFGVRRLFVVDRRAPGAIGFAAVDGEAQPFQAGSALRVELRPIAARDWPAAGVKAVHKALTAGGLFDAEAESLLKIWQKRLLEADGVTVFHILPPDEYDRMLPLTVLPVPAARPVRVGIALHPHMEIEPDLTARVGALLRQLDDPKFEKREAASKALLEIGPLAIAMMRAELEKGPPLERVRRIQSVLQRVDAADWLSLPAGAKKK
jgi:hypothetical protein